MESATLYRKETNCSCTSAFLHPPPPQPHFLAFSRCTSINSTDGSRYTRSDRKCTSGGRSCRFSARVLPALNCPKATASGTHLHCYRSLFFSISEIKRNVKNEINKMHRLYQPALRISLYGYLLASSEKPYLFREALQRPKRFLQQNFNSVYYTSVHPPSRLCVFYCVCVKRQRQQARQAAICVKMKLCFTSRRHRSTQI